MPNLVILRFRVLVSVHQLLLVDRLQEMDRKIWLGPISLKLAEWLQILIIIKTARNKRELAHPEYVGS